MMIFIQWKVIWWSSYHHTTYLPALNGTFDQSNNIYYDKILSLHPLVVIWWPQSVRWYKSNSKLKHEFWLSESLLWKSFQMELWTLMTQKIWWSQSVWWSKSSFKLKQEHKHEPWGNWKEHLSSFSTLAWLSTSPLLHLSNLASTCCCNSTLLPNPCGPNIVLDSTVFWSLHKFPPYHLFFPNSGFPSHVLLVLTFQVLGWVGSHVVSSLGLSGRATAIMNPIKALGLNDGGGLASPTIIGPHGQLARHQQPIIAIKSIRALSLARKPFKLAAHGWLDQ